MVRTAAYPAVLDSLEKMRRFVEEAAEAAGLDRSRAYKLQLAVDEIATNIVMYGFGNAHPEETVVIRGEKTDSSLIITLEDAGPAFDPEGRKLPSEADLARPLEERGIGGLGIFLAVKGVDRFDYERRDGKNYNIFEVSLSRAEGATA